MCLMSDASKQSKDLRHTLVWFQGGRPESAQGTWPCMDLYRQNSGSTRALAPSDRGARSPE